MISHLLNRIHVHCRRHFYGHVPERRSRRWIKKHAPAWLDVTNLWWRGFNRVQTAIAYPALTAWLYCSERLRRRSVLANESRTVALAKTHRHLHLVPVQRRFSRGEISTYFHFLFDILLPVSRLIEQTDPGVTFTLNRLGGVGYLLEEVFRDRVRYVDEAPKDAETVALHGMSPRVVHVTSSELEDFAKVLARQVGASLGQPRDTVVMIDRPMPTPERGHTGGVRRRIRNHAAVAQRLTPEIVAGYRFVDVSLEGMPLKDQVELFDRACLIIAQHGAALGNLVWAQAGTDVVEVYNNYFFDFFRRLSRSKKLHHHLWPEMSGHPTLNPDEFFAWLSTHPATGKYFRSES